jgi:hypothetical protein
MTVIPEMPKDWWPDEVIVTGKNDDIQLSFAITASGFSCVEDDEIKVNLEALREEIWISMHDPEQRKKFSV